VQAGVAFERRRQRGGEVLLGEGDGRVDAQHAARLVPRALGRFGGGVGGGEQRRAALVEGQPLGREREPARGAVEQPGAEPILERGHAGAHHGLRHAQRGRRGGERAGLHDAREADHRDQLVGRRGHGRRLYGIPNSVDSRTRLIARPGDA